MPGNAWEIARIIEPHVAQVLVVSPSDTGIRQARAKTDRLDARTLARLLAAGSLDGVWVPDRQTWMMRRRLSRRSQLVWARNRSKNQIHAVLVGRSLVYGTGSAGPIAPLSSPAPDATIELAANPERPCLAPPSSAPASDVADDSDAESHPGIQVTREGVAFGYATDCRDPHLVCGGVGHAAVQVAPGPRVV